ncbi:VOC family protein [Microbacterium sp. HD4P20]|uniref:VOC family protein n=1 Tax=Microbacterium sp. HD4P20 TaxID=2864874 RepID=UPI001C63BCB5|nr:VOC family protein [Microbacterium sp. HD4P20]MCP2638284.1 VOC family protein [Microbacterium sp. HD4P20]
MDVTSMYPVLLTTDVATSAGFYREHFGFEVTFESDWYVSLKSGSWELAILEASHSTIPEGYRGVTARGILINFEVPDVDAVHDRLVAAGLEPVLPLRSEDFGQRHAIFAGPDGALLDIITPIPPSGAFAEQFSESALAETEGATHE